MTMPSPDGQRIPPRMRADEYVTYQIVSPRSTHSAPATCDQTDCLAYQRGWQTVVNESDELGQRQAWYIRNRSGRRYSEEREGMLTRFTFPAGQQCFGEHRVSLERPPLFVVRDGDWRGNPRGTRPRVFERAEDWVDDFATHQDRLSRIIEEG